MEEYKQTTFPRINPAELLRIAVDMKVETVIQSYSVPDLEKKPKVDDEYNYIEDDRTDYE